MRPPLLIAEPDQELLTVGDTDGIYGLPSQAGFRTAGGDGVGVGVAPIGEQSRVAAKETKTEYATLYLMPR